MGEVGTVDFSRLQLHARSEVGGTWFACLRTPSNIVDRTGLSSLGVANGWTVEGPTPFLYVKTDSWFCSPEFEAKTQNAAEALALLWLAGQLTKFKDPTGES